MTTDCLDPMPTPSEEQVRALLEACGLPLTIPDGAESRCACNFSLSYLRRAVASQN